LKINGRKGNVLLEQKKVQKGRNAAEYEVKEEKRKNAHLKKIFMSTVTR